jgi:hypothetical protein
VVDRTRQHPSELRTADAHFERGEALFRFVHRGVVVLRRPQLEENLGVLDVAGELLVRVDRLLNPRPLAVYRLGLPGVVPKAGGERLRV